MITNIIANTAVLSPYVFESMSLKSQNVVIAAPLNAHSSINCTAPKHDQIKRSLTVFSFSLYTNAPTVATAAIIPNNCPSKYCISNSILIFYFMKKIIFFLFIKNTS